MEVILLWKKTKQKKIWFVNNSEYHHINGAIFEKKRNQNGRLKKSEFFETANSKYFL